MKSRITGVDLQQKLSVIFFRTKERLELVTKLKAKGENFWKVERNPLNEEEGVFGLTIGGKY